MTFEEHELGHHCGGQQCMFVERARPRIGKKVMNEGSGRAGSEQRDEEERAQAEESWRGARGGLWGSSPPLFLGREWGVMTT